MRISDWSSDVCSSDLWYDQPQPGQTGHPPPARHPASCRGDCVTASTQSVEPFDLVIFGGTGDLAVRKLLPALFHRFLDGQIPEIGSASCRERVCQYV